MIIDLVGKRFERLVVLKLAGKNKNNSLIWECRCDCGNLKIAIGGELKRGRARSCGCLLIEERKAATFDHGMSFHPAYRSWIYLRARCTNKKNSGYYLYGARGIKFCDRWKSFKNFWEDMGPTWRPGLSIDRINTNGDYEPSNCRWATPKEQANNRRAAHVLNTPLGEMSIVRAAEEFCIPVGILAARLRYGWPEKDLFLPVRKTRIRS